MARRSLPGFEQRYGSAEVCELARISPRQLDYWCGLGLFPDIHDPSPGSGRPRSFGRRDVELASVVRKLLDAGVAMSTISKAIRGGGFHDMLVRLADAVTAVDWTAEAERIA